MIDDWLILITGYHQYSSQGLVSRVSVDLEFWISETPSRDSLRMDIVLRLFSIPLLIRSSACGASQTGTYVYVTGAMTKSICFDIRNHRSSANLQGLHLPWVSLSDVWRHLTLSLDCLVASDVFSYDRFHDFHNLLGPSTITAYLPRSRSFYILFRPPFAGIILS